MKNSKPETNISHIKTASLVPPLRPKILHKKHYKNSEKIVYKKFHIQRKLSFYLVKTNSDFQQNLPKKEENELNLPEILENSDILNNAYEGGFKVWECSVDLAAYLEKSKIAFDGKKVLELGCGHGLPGLSALQQGAGLVIFQDLNREVLQFVTRPNVTKNCPDLAAKKSAFVSGHWGSKKLSRKILAKFGQVDLIISADTIYSKENEFFISQLAASLLKRGGVFLLAAKRYYFGRDGSVSGFLQKFAEEDGWSAKTLKSTADGRSNVRDIVELRLG